MIFIKEYNNKFYLCFTVNYNLFSEYDLCNRTNIKLELELFIIDNILYLLELYKYNYSIKFNTNNFILTDNNNKKSLLIEIYYDSVYIYSREYKEFKNIIEFLYPNYKKELSNNINFTFYNFLDFKKELELELKIKDICPDIVDNKFQFSNNLLNIFGSFDNLDIILNDSINCYDKNNISNGYFYIKDYIVYDNKGNFLGYLPNNSPTIKKCISY